MIAKKKQTNHVYYLYLAFHPAYELSHPMYALYVSLSVRSVVANRM